MAAQQCWQVRIWMGNAPKPIDLLAATRSIRLESCIFASDAVAAAFLAALLAASRRGVSVALRSDHAGSYFTLAKAASVLHPEPDPKPRRKSGFAAVPMSGAGSIKIDPTPEGIAEFVTTLGTKGLIPVHRGEALALAFVFVDERGVCIAAADAKQTECPTLKIAPTASTLLAD